VVEDDEPLALLGNAWNFFRSSSVAFDHMS